MIQIGDYVVGIYRQRITIGKVISIANDHYLIIRSFQWILGDYFTNSFQVKANQFIKLEDFLKEAYKHQIKKTNLKIHDIVIFKRFGKVYVGLVTNGFFDFFGLYSIVVIGKSYRKKTIISRLKTSIKLKDILTAMSNDAE